MKTLCVWFTLLVVLALSACGGGTVSSSAQTSAGNTSVTTYSLTVVVLDNGIQATYVKPGSNVTVQATVTQTTTTKSTGGLTSTHTTPAPNVIVVFTSPGGTFNPAAGNTLTGSNGIASLVMTVGSVAGAYSVTATTQGSSAGATGSANYLINSAVVPQIKLTLLDAHGQPTQQLQAGSVGYVQVVAQQLDETVGQTSGTLTPAAGAQITFSSDGATFDPTNGQVLTDVGGNAKITFKANATQGAFTMSASATIQGATASASTLYSISAPPLVLGSGTPFQQGLVTVSPATLAAGDTATVTVRLTDGAGNAFALPVSVVFSSSCSQAGTATFTSPVPAIAGLATSNYTPGTGCLGVDQVTAQVTLPGQSIPTTATGAVTVTAPKAGGLVFNSATPTNIAIKGHGTSTHPEQSHVTFTVVSTNGVAVAGQLVNFTLSSQGGGANLSAPSAVSNSNGQVTAIVNSGSVSSTVVVIATLADGSGTTQSGGIVISSGSPEQAHFSLSATQLNIEAWNYDGITTTLTIRAADHYSNPVPDGTTISFTADGGSVSPSCTTAGGACSVTMTSQNPRPANGRVVVLATSPGDETFTDTNGNGLYDLKEPFQALPEAWRDDNENGKYDVGEFFIDANNNGMWDAANTTYAGSLCNPGAYPCDSQGTYVRQQIVLVFATSSQRIQVSPAAIAINNINPLTVRIYISDQNGNLPPANSTVSVTTSAGKLLSTTSTYTIGDSDARGPLEFDQQIIGDGTAASGVLTVTITTPKGLVTTSQTSISQTVTQITPSAIALSPATFTVSANQTMTLQTQAIVTTAGPPAGPMAGVVPIINCMLGASTGLSLSPESGVQPTGANGTTILAIDVVTGPAPTGTATCTVTAGSKSATLTIKTGP